jgi:endonuclease YncB( thermonuclease family)
MIKFLDSARSPAIIVMALLTFSTHAAENEPCMPAATITAHVTVVRDGRTLLLDDGRELRLAGVEVSDASRTALQALASGRMLQIGNAGVGYDRYGRLFGFAFVDGARQSLQAALLEQGAARVSGRVGDKSCAEALLARERAARKAHRGLWADPNFAALQAHNVIGIQAEKGRFALVEGKVLSVHESGSTI